LSIRRLDLLPLPSHEEVACSGVTMAGFDKLVEGVLLTGEMSIPDFLLEGDIRWVERSLNIAVPPPSHAIDGKLGPKIKRGAR